MGTAAVGRQSSPCLAGCRFSSPLLQSSLCKASPKTEPVLAATLASRFTAQSPTSSTACEVLGENRSKVFISIIKICFNILT